MYTLEQIKENRREWVKVLRSGEIKQAKGQLRTTDGMCCLGVLAKIAGCRWKKIDGEWSADNEWQVAPDRAVQFVGLRARAAFFSGASDGLTIRNDRGADFPRIADIIESNPPGLFLTDEEIAASLNTGAKTS